MTRILERTEPIRKRRRKYDSVSPLPCHTPSRHQVLRQRGELLSMAPLLRHAPAQLAVGGTAYVAYGGEDVDHRWPLEVGTLRRPPPSTTIGYA